jgi:hypothetical protein
MIDAKRVRVKLETENTRKAIPNLQKIQKRMHQIPFPLSLNSKPFSPLTKQD